MTYDYIIIGAGAAGLLLTDALGKDDFFSGKSILLLDKDAKQTNDRTWCFWEKGVGEFDALLHKKWDAIYFAGKTYKEQLSIAPYSYKMIRGLDFYSHYLAKIAQYPNITFIQETVTNITEIDAFVEVKTEKQQYTCTKVFNSIYSPKEVLSQQKHPVLQQHFLGWFVKTKSPVFNATQATFMDFSIPQKGNTRFMYVLPISNTEALIEYTLFSEKLLPKTEYETAIKDYLKKLGCTDYEIIEKEKGSIPMTCYNFSGKNTNNIIYIGTVGGWSKPSTGYTFMPTVKKTKDLVQHLKKEKPLVSFAKKSRFWFYDLLLLDILYKDNSKGELIFESLFKNRKPQAIFRFLDEDTNLWEDVKIILGCPKIPFIKALLGRLF